jgi:hypothetical protein
VAGTTCHQEVPGSSEQLQEQGKQRPAMEEVLGMSLQVERGRMRERECG